MLLLLQLARNLPQPAAMPVRLLHAQSWHWRLARVHQQLLERALRPLERVLVGRVQQAARLPSDRILGPAVEIADPGPGFDWGHQHALIRLRIVRRITELICALAVQEAPHLGRCAVLTFGDGAFLVVAAEVRVRHRVQSIVEL